MDRSGAWREQAKIAARRAFLEAVGDSQPSPVSVGKGVSVVAAQVSGDDGESDRGEPVDDESGSDDVAEVEPDQVPKTETRHAWDAKDPTKRLRPEVVIPVPFPTVPMSVRKARVIRFFFVCVPVSELSLFLGS
jgi:hypothetical protein